MGRRHADARRQADADNYTVKRRVARRCATTSSVLDTGAKDDGGDISTFMGGVAAAGTADGIFLLRRTSFIPDEVSEASASWLCCTAR